MPKLFTYQNQAVLAGLTWGPGRQIGFLQRTPLAANDLALHWDDRTAVVPQEPEYLGVASLLSVLAGHLSEEERIGRVFCAIEITEQHLFFAAVLVNGKPAIGAERMFKTPAELISHIEVECSNGQIDRLAIDPYLAEDIAEDVTHRVPGCYLCPPATSASGPTSNPVCVTGKLAPKRPVWQVAAGAGGSVLALTTVGFLLFPVQSSKPSIAAPTIAPVHATFRNEAAFARTCLAAFAGDWPIAPGWQVISEGCATPEMRDPALNRITGFAPDHAVAYRIYQLRGGFDPAIARKAAEAVTAARATTAARANTEGSANTTTRAVDMTLQGNRLISSTEIEVPMLKAEIAPNPVSLTPAALLAATEAVFLGMADSIVLNGGGNAHKGGSNSNAGSGATVRVILKSGFEDIFERVARIEGAQIARLSRSGDTVTLEITGAKSSWRR